MVRPPNLDAYFNSGCTFGKPRSKTWELEDNNKVFFDIGHSGFLCLFPNYLLLSEMNDFDLCVDKEKLLLHSFLFC